MAREESAGDVTQATDQSVRRTTAHATTRPRRGGLKTFSSLKNNRDYRYLFTGNLFANGAQWLQLITIGWLALDVSGSVFHSIMAVAVRALPILLLGPWGGVLADRWDRRKLAMATQAGLAVSAFIFAVLVTRGQVSSVWYIYAYTLVGGVAFTIMQPVRQALIANTVHPADMGNALALNAMTVTSMRLIGAAVGGVLIETVGFQWNFFVEASLYIGMALLLIPMRTPYRAASTARSASPTNNLVEGLGYILKSRVIMRLMVLNFTRTAVFMPLLLLLPGYTSEALNAGAGIGTAMIVSMGIGGVIASLVISSWGFFTKKGLVSLITLISGSAVIFSLGLAHWVWYAVPIMMVMGLSQTHFIVSNQTLVQTIVPDALRGRVSSVWHYEQGLIPLFAGLIGVMAEAIGIVAALAWVGGVALALALLFLLWFKEIRALD
jgi:MFS family permease